LGIGEETIGTFIGKGYFFGVMGGCRTIGFLGYDILFENIGCGGDCVTIY